MSDPCWYEDAVIYQVHVKSFYDSDGDGFGDFKGLTLKLSHVKELGATAIWLLPFYPSPLRDDGYDIAAYDGIHPRYGDMDDFQAFVARAHELGLKVITELVINHTSDQHAWFQAARRAPPGSAEREVYVWSDTRDRFKETRIIFTDTEASNWTWDEVAGAYFWHRFFSHQPDLNHDNPRVVEAVIEVMRFWLDLGVDGLRLDAIPYLCVQEGTSNENLPRTHAVIRQIRAAMDATHPGRMLLAEANQWPEDVCEYFGAGDECHMAFHFPLMPRLYMALAQEDRRPIVEILEQTPQIPEGCQWAIFLRNHDELTLEMVTAAERDFMYRIYAPDPRMRINVGIRRRLAPLVNNDRRRIELLSCLLLSFPGTPIIYYGDELGMGDDTSLDDRDGVRTPMQWSGAPGGGFSVADPASYYLPLIADPVFGAAAVNVEAQRADPSSLLRWFQDRIAARKELRSPGAVVRFLTPANPSILAYLRGEGDEALLCVANLAGSPQPAELDLAEHVGSIPVELGGGVPFPAIGASPYFLSLPAYGFLWFRLREAGAGLHRVAAAPDPPPVLVLKGGWESVIEQQDALEQRLLPAFLPHQRWFGGKGAAITAVDTRCQLRACPDTGRRWLLCLATVSQRGRAARDYFVPLALAWDAEGDRLHRERPGLTLARVRQAARTGVLYDALADEAFVRQLLKVIDESATLPLGNGEELSGERIAAAAWGVGDLAPIRAVGVEQSHTSVVLGDRLVLKAYRALQESPNPEVEVGRFLTEQARFGGSPPVLGTIELCRDQNPPLTVALLQGFADNQGDLWNVTLAELDGFLRRQPGPPAGRGHAPTSGGRASPGRLLGTLGLRTGELHAALSGAAAAAAGGAFAPEPVTPDDLGAWRDAALAELRRALDAAERLRDRLEPNARRDVDRLVALRSRLERAICGLIPERVDAVKTRYHGDLHLGQVLVTGDDVQIIDFEGEQPRPGFTRRSKHCPLRDVAGVLRSLDYAASGALRGVMPDPAKGGGDPDLCARLEVAARAWVERASADFLEGYRRGIEGCGAYPSPPGAAEDLLRLFVLEKSLYELCYEVDHRPDWVAIPLKGILAQMAS